MNKIAHAMQVVKSYQELLGHPFHEWNWNALVIIPLNNFKQINPLDLKHSDKVFAIRSVVQECIQYLHVITVFTCHFVLMISKVMPDTPEPLFAIPIVTDLIQYLYLVKSCF